MRKGARGITLIELVAILVVAGVAIPVLMTMWATVSWQSVRSEGIGDAAFYAQGLLEEIKSKRFDENTTAPWNAALGVETGENSAEAFTFDDVDDFAGTTDENITLPAGGFRRRVSVAYVLPDANNVWQPCSPAPSSCSTAAGCSSCDQCCFKQVTVSVERTGGADSGNVSMATIVAGF